MCDSLWRVAHGACVIQVDAMGAKFQKARDALAPKPGSKKKHIPAMWRFETMH